jgi:hypothetical protein
VHGGPAGNAACLKAVPALAKDRSQPGQKGARLETGLEPQSQAGRRVRDCRRYQPGDDEKRTWQAERYGLLSADRVESRAGHRGRCQNDACTYAPRRSCGSPSARFATLGSLRWYDVHDNISASLKRNLAFRRLAPPLGR